MNVDVISYIYPSLVRLHIPSAAHNRGILGSGYVLWSNITHIYKAIVLFCVAVQATATTVYVVFEDVDAQNGCSKTSRGALENIKHKTYSVIYFENDQRRQEVLCYISFCMHICII